jgi:hypothetical protein
VTPADLFAAALAAVNGDELELARRLGYTNVNSAGRQFNRWRAGKSGMDFAHTIALLEIAGWLRVPKPRPR